ncbi:hypothetical protein BD289DRAFT_451656 [Coniella lustricola]|uniref:non-specific serine/threonine protein kinase n=1 Tax=Coniella lustricola TaxID=2025994 RepID=A0A2T3ADY1_9PEZI|nr:hypothetical protein BD289DRAFT_451656 [Coniella lustricola]
MELHHPVKHSSSRTPLGENPKRANHGSANDRTHWGNAKPSECKENISAESQESSERGKQKRPAKNASQRPLDPRASSVASQASQDRRASRRASQMLTASASNGTAVDGKLKSYIGPWQLGKTLGKGSSARVRLARHRNTHQSVAVKIISKRTASLSQAGSIAQLDKLEKHCPEEEDGVRRLPVTVEREIAIMKLIEHPNIIQILDVWENRDEIYLILEYCESRDMFTWINKYGPLGEHDTVYVFRQMMCAMEYCHSFNICHRDLKPENILLSDEGDVKIIDFGMAALHQNDQNLRTACGSPHYAAPELLKSRTYRGDKRGIYTMPEEFSSDAKDLIRRILVVDPDKRISIAEMWEHPLIKKYDKKPGFENHRKQPVDMKARSTDALINPRDVDPQILRQLRAMWHSSDLKDIRAKLTSKGPNEQKVFYHLLEARRERLLEDYHPDLTHSTSDYHHLLRPQAWATRVATREFHTHGRTPSRFTAISTIADIEAETTIRTYDPYHASRDLTPVQASHAKITIHRDKLEPGTARSIASSSIPSKTRRRLNPSLHSRKIGYAHSQFSSMSSLPSNRRRNSLLVVKQRNKRGIDFSGLRKGPARSSRRRNSDHRTTAPASCPGEAKVHDSVTGPLHGPAKRSDANHNFPADTRSSIGPVNDEDMVWFSHSIAKDCDDAFGSSIIGSASEIGNDYIASSLTPFSLDFGTPPASHQTFESSQKPVTPWYWRPLPPTPPSELTPSPLRLNPVRAETISTIYKQKAEQCAREAVLSVPPLQVSSRSARRTTSAPVYAQKPCDSKRLPSINESGPQPTKTQARIVSAPTPSLPTSLGTPNNNGDLEFLARTANTIRLVESPSGNQVRDSRIVPAPLIVRKKVPESGIGGAGIQKLNKSGRYSLTPKAYCQLDKLPEEPAQCDRSSSNGSSTGRKKKFSSWLHRVSRSSSKGDATEVANVQVNDEASQQAAPCVEFTPRFASTSAPTSALTATAVQSTKKKSIIFWKSSSKDTQHMSVAVTPRVNERPSANPDDVHSLSGELTHHGLANATNGRKIEPQQNWLARLFRVRPAMRYLCLQMSCRRARQEVTILLREWRKWGMRDIQVDKDRNIVFARVSKKNFLQIKEVHFAVEIVTVIEHGKRNHLSIIRFTQEKGAASSFHKVVDTMNSVFSSRNILVQDERKSKMMIKTLNS